MADTTPPPAAVDATLLRTRPLAGLPAEAPTQASRTTVLPQVTWVGERPVLHHEPRERFVPLQALGAGGMGEVLLVRDHDVNRMVAVKRIRSELLHASGLARFVEEVQTIARLDHPASCRSTTSGSTRRAGTTS